MKPKPKPTRNAVRKSNIAPSRNSADAVITPNARRGHAGSTMCMRSRIRTSCMSKPSAVYGVGVLDAMATGLLDSRTAKQAA